MVTHGPIAITPKCPRCGYDQSGEMAAWTDRCPVEGRCTECGCFFRWAIVLRPGRTTHRWSFEHADSPRGLVRRACQTTARAAVPSRYWRSMGLTTPVRPVRIAVLLVAWWLVVRAVVSLPSAAILQIDSGMASPHAPFWDALTAGLTPQRAASFYRLAFEGGWADLLQGGRCQSLDSVEVLFLSLWPLTISTVWLIFTAIWYAGALRCRALAPHLLRAWLMSWMIVPVFHEMLNIAVAWGYLTKGALHDGVILAVLISAPAVLWVWWRAAVTTFVPEASLRFFVYANLSVILAAPVLHFMRITMLVWILP